MSFCNVKKVKVVLYEHNLLKFYLVEKCIDFNPESISRISDDIYEYTIKEENVALFQRYLLEAQNDFRDYIDTLTIT